MLLLGIIDNAGSDTKNNHTATTPFELPNNMSIFVMAPGTTIQVLGKETKDATFLPTTDMIPVPTANVLFEVGALPKGTLATRKTDVGAGSVRVYGRKVPY